MKRWTTFLGALASNLIALGVAAQDGAGDRATSFQAVSGSAHQDVPGGTLLVAAYAVVLFVLVLYVVYLAAMQQSATKELGRLEALLAKKISSATGEKTEKASEEKKD